eukprot:TRINITY_DN27498_c0_g1_i1.p1 TRINITY_DN27498_c0_g1~~TRINITY_DN27498_c0_g1_i1.p1  ORF type:complete len:236 (+),score=58.69 TRINITY_DN27498_c0_g1_i1:43-750(+)
MVSFFFFQAEDGIRDAQESRGLGDVYKRQILEAYYPGQLGGDAIVNTLLGLNNPGGKTPVTWYPATILDRSMDDMELNSGDGLTHLYYQGEVLWPFGHGLSYTTFSYGWGSSSDPNPTSPHEMALHPGVEYRCNVTNTGPVAGDAVVLGFVTSSDPNFPRQKLFDFERVSLQPGQSKAVLLTVLAEHLSVVDEQGQRWLRPARFNVRVGDVIAPAERSFELIGEAQLLEDLGRFF